MSKPVLSLEDVHTLTSSPTPEYELCHIYGLMRREEKILSQTFWILSDESAPEGIKIKLNGPLSDYPKPKPGDVVRVHRLRVNTATPEVAHPNTVVVWATAKYNPTPIHSSRSPTITDEDERRRKQLELLFYSTIREIKEVVPPAGKIGYFYSVAGRVKAIQSDQFQNLEIEFSDGTGDFILRVFAKANDKEDNSHFDVAQGLRPGDYFFVNNAKLDQKRLNLSANLQWGKSLRRVEVDSPMGVKLSEKCPDLPQASPIRSHNTSASRDTPLNETDPTPQSHRRSPILTRSRARSANSPQTGSPSFVSFSQQSNDRQISLTPSPQKSANIPEYTIFSHIPKVESSFHFFNIVGQVRGEPNEASKFGNWVFQIYDGSNHNIISYHTNEVLKPEEKCLVVYVYSKQKESDTNEHIEQVKKLKSGDFVLVRNIKASWRAGRLKLEMNANLTHNKSIEVIDKDSALGIRINRYVEFPEEPVNDDVELTQIKD